MEDGMLIYLNEYRKAKAAKVPARRIDEELLCVNWNPAFGVVALTTYQTPREQSPHLPENLADVEPSMMDRIYALASQI
jgi:hypothetical protein